MKHKSDPTSRGEAGLDQFYSSIWHERWPQIRAQLRAESAKFLLKNPLITEADYELDPASVVVAGALQVGASHRVLDMCAAPGGKSLVQIFSQPEATYVLNDLSKDRVFRLRRILQDHLPRALFEKIKVTSRDASRWGQHEKAAYHRVLLDAPCSGERHMFENARALEEWSPKRSTGLAGRQYALFCSAEQVLLEGGRLVYSTCSISPLENDGVAERYFKRKGDEAKLRRCEIDTQSADLAKKFGLELEPTSQGYLILPDRSRGAGPMYLAIFEKISGSP